MAANGVFELCQYCHEGQAMQTLISLEFGRLALCRMCWRRLAGRG
jgi:hypothetical protein